ncbi:hypothetical protein Q1695_001049 [Nippostrongylus brasiliensis]|nr:hypothetical protein Q1695_001049 [Nippostrongylus brasiliensis]
MFLVDISEQVTFEPADTVAEAEVAERKLVMEPADPALAPDAPQLAAAPSTVTKNDAELSSAYLHSSPLNPQRGRWPA